ncbi:MAG: hypothetical protein AABY00_02715 [Nanoarchaeota archaeon]
MALVERTEKRYALDGVVVQETGKKDPERVFGSGAHLLVSHSNEHGEFSNLKLPRAADFPSGREISGRIQQVFLHRTDVESPYYGPDATITLPYDIVSALPLLVGVRVVQLTQYESVLAQ